MRVYTFQKLAVLADIGRNGQYVARPAAKQLNDLGWGCAYQWMVTQMEARGLPRPAPDAYPIWAWQAWNGPEHRRPDLRDAGIRAWLREEPSPYVLLTLDVPDSQLLLSDFHAWHWPLNYWYLGRERDQNRFLKRCGSKNYFDTKPLPSAPLHEELLRTWDVVFDLKACARLLGIKRMQQVVQATFWVLRADHVQAVELVGQGMPRTRIPLPTAYRTRRTAFS